MPGFRDCFVVDVAPQLGIRQTRLLEGLYVVTKEDVTERRHFADSVARGRDYYTPYRSLLPREVKGLLVAGRHYSATSSAQRMSREIPPCMAMGEAAGEAAALALEGGVALDRVDVGKLQARLRAQRRRSGRPAGGQRHRPEGRRMTRCRCSTQPLSGIKVLDFTQVMMGPCATQMLADYGADVIKIERPGAGDLSRTSLADDPDGLNNPVFRSLNRNKRSIALDLRGEAGKAIVYDLVEDRRRRGEQFPRRRHGAHGLRLRGAVEDQPAHHLRLRLGLRPERAAVAQGRPGHPGPGADRRDGAQARSRACRCRSMPTALADYSAGMHLVQGILLALMQREKTGVGQSLSVSLYDSMLAMQMQEAAMWLQRKRELNWGAFPLTGVFETTDGAVVIVGAFKAESAAGHLPRARPARPVGRSATTPPSPSRSRTRRSCTRCSAASSRPTRRHTGSPGSRSRTCSARRCRRWARRWRTEQTEANGMIVSLDANGSGRNEPLKLVASPITMDAAAFQLRHAPPRPRRARRGDPGRAGLRAAIASPSCARRKVLS